MPDVHIAPSTPRHIAAAVVLQIHGGIAPDESRSLAERVLFAADRAGIRGHGEHLATDDEVRRAQNTLARHGVAATHDDVRAALNDAFVYAWGES